MQEQGWKAKRWARRSLGGADADGSCWRLCDRRTTAVEPTSMRKRKACCFVCFSVSRRFGWPLLGCPLWSVRKENVVFEWCRGDETILSRAVRRVTRGCISTVVSLNTSQPRLLCIKTRKVHVDVLKRTVTIWRSRGPMRTSNGMATCQLAQAWACLPSLSDAGHEPKDTESGFYFSLGW